MTTKDVDLGRRQFLVRASTVVGGVGALYTAYPFLSSWLPSAKAEAAGAPVEADISKLREGEQAVYEWRGKPVFILRRSKRMVEDLVELNGKLRDPMSDDSIQPADAKNIYRSIKPEYLVVIGICTHLGCTPLLKPEIASISPSWLGGYFCPCHGSSYDLAGRVYKDVPAPENLPVPDYKYLSDSVILIGES